MVCLLSLGAVSSVLAIDPPVIIDPPVVEFHMDQQDIEDGQYSLKEIIKQGNLLFDARFNKADGQGRPASTGTGAPRIADQPEFIRTSAPESNSCAGCHNIPSSGGAGDIVANVFVLAQALDPVTFSVSPEFSNERNTLGMHGAGAIEMLAREMSDDLIAIREAARAEAEESGESVTKDLVTKDVSFGSITVLPDGKIDPSNIEGVDWDLIIKPFHQKGAVVSLREFTNNAMNHHHGMQTTERFGLDVDADQDGMVNELTTGDVTALSLYQATLPTPAIQWPKRPAKRKEIRRGRDLFNQVGCATCHKPELLLNNPVFSEPNPYNPSGNLHPDDVDEVVKVNLVRRGFLERVEKGQNKGAGIVNAFTDLKRWDLNDDDLNHFANEQLPQGMLSGFADPDDFTIADQPRPTEQFLTRKLWDAGSSDPYGHRGDLTTLTEAIHYHGGDARESRDEYFTLSEEDQLAVIKFLKSMKVPTK